MKRRRSLTHVGGAARTSGDRAVAERLAAALDVAPAPEPRGGVEADDPDRTHVHGFHTYPARMHPATAARLVDLVSGPGAAVLDPFCGSGTVLVEALIAGRKAIGTDLNPLAVQLARLKTTPRDEASCAALSAAAREVAAFADERRTRRAGATRRYPPEEVSRRASDTSERASSRRIAAGYPSRLFIKKTADLVARLLSLRALLPLEPLPACVAVDDAARLATVKASTVDAVVTSPPYVGTYDYLTQHALRLRWLSADARAFAAGEMGSRRRYARLDARAARDAWTRELASTLKAMARVCRKGARVVLLMADSGARGEALRADVLVEEEARRAGFDFVARASQDRPHFHGETAEAFRDVPRAEHAIALEKR
jgi:DNA modification methylase